MRLGGIRNMKRLPGMVFVVDVRREETAMHEANLLGIPVIALGGHQLRSAGIDYVVPSNDDAIRAIKLLTGKIADAALEGKALRKDQEPEEPSEGVGEGASESARPRRTAHVVETEEEVEEGALLGESTLAKLSATRKPEEVAAETAAASVGADVPSVDAPDAAQTGTAAVEESSADAPASPQPDTPAADADGNSPETA
jgi:small subunit ribosomal protein S2